jgi:hypothetical protein
MTNLDPGNADLRAQMALPVIPDSSVFLIANDSTCEQAVAAFEAAIGRPIEVRRVHVIQYGAHYFFVRDPQQAGYLAIFTPAWVKHEAIIY